MKIGWMSEVELSLDGGSHGDIFSIDFEVDDMLCSALALVYYKTIVSPGDNDTPSAISHECTDIGLFFDAVDLSVMTNELIEELKELILIEIF